MAKMIPHELAGKLFGNTNKMGMDCAHCAYIVSTRIMVRWPQIHNETEIRPAIGRNVCEVEAKMNFTSGNLLKEHFRKKWRERFVLVWPGFIGGKMAKDAETRAVEKMPVAPLETISREYELEPHFVSVRKGRVGGRFAYDPVQDVLFYSGIETEDA